MSSSWRIGNEKPSRVSVKALKTWLPVLLIALMAAAPLWGPGLVNTRGGGDSPFLIQRTLDMAEALRHGHVPPRWMAHAAYDLGYPFFNHYAALPFYLSGGLTALGLNPLAAIQATQTLGFLLAAVGMALWAQRLYPSRAAVLLAVAAYTFAPFHMVNVYVRGDSLSEFYAFVWYPLLLWALDRVAERPSGGRIAAASLLYGALILTHNVSAMIFSPFALLYALLSITTETQRPQSKPLGNDKDEGKRQKKPLRLCVFASLRSKKLYLLLPFVFGILLTAWFWLPAVLETGFGQMGAEFTAGYFHYSNHFRGWNLVQPRLLFDYSVAGAVSDAGPFAMGATQAFLALGGCLALLLSPTPPSIPPLRGEATSSISPPSGGTKGGRKQTLYLLSGLALATVMLTPLSKPLWDHLPLLALTQFPWRFLSVQALFTAALTGALAPLQNPKSKIQNLIPLFSIGLLTLAALLNLRLDRLRISAADLTWDNLLLYEAFTGNIGTTIRYEYLPAEVIPRLYISEAVVDGALDAQRLRRLDGGLVTESHLRERAPQRQVWDVTLDAPGAVVFPLNRWPGWNARVDGVATPAFAAPGSGRLAVELPAGTHTVELRLGLTPLRALGLALSAVSAAAGAALWMNNRAPGATWPGKRAWARALLWGGGLLALALVGPLLAQSGSAPGEATFFDFHQMPFPHAGPVDFGAARLERVVLTADVAAPGDALGVGLTWTGATAPLTATVRLVSPAEPRHEVPYALAEAACRLPCAEGLTLALPETLARGLYLVEVRLFDAARELFGRTPQGRGMGVLYVGAMRVPRGPQLPADAPTLATFRDLTLHTLDTPPLSSPPVGGTEGGASPPPEGIEGGTSPPPGGTEGGLRLALGWSTPGTPRNWSLSLRLHDAAGRQIVQRDLQPGYGYLPTTLWQPGELVTDFPTLPLPEGLAPGVYTLHVIAYLEATLEVGGEFQTPITLTQATLYDLRDACCEQERQGATILCQAGGIALLGTDLPERFAEGLPLDFTAEWNAVSAPTAEVTATWALLDAGRAAIGEVGGPLAPGANPATWPRHAWVRAPVRLPLPPTLPPGDYRLQVTLHAGAEAVTCALPRPLALEPRPRAFAAPEIAHPQAAHFGERLRLLGYDLEQHADTLTLTLWWQTDGALDRDYKRFVHLYDPATEEILAQNDAMPRAWSYPTSWWLSGEVVSETVTLPRPAGGAYRIAVGWYDPETGERLSATQPDGTAWPLDRVVLGEGR